MRRYLFTLLFCLSLASVVFSGCRKGCVDPTALNYEKGAIRDDALCEYLGCTDPNAGNFDALTTADDGSCLYCKDPDALNYYPGSAINTRSVCIYSGSAIVFTNDEQWNGSQVFVDESPVGTLYWYGTDWWEEPACNAPQQIVVELPPGDYRVTLANSTRSWHFTVQSQECTKVKIK